MSSELQRVASDLLACIDQIPGITGYLARTAGRCREQATYLASLGSSNPAANRAALQLDAAARACEQAAEYAGYVPQRARSWVEQMVGGERAVNRTPNDTAARTPDRGEIRPVAGGRRQSGDGPAEIMQRLPDRERRGKTTGIFVDEDGDLQELVSGRGDLERDALDLCREKGWRLFDRTSHVEIKFAMHMRARGIKHATLYLNNQPCDRLDWNCTTLLPRFLRPGARLVVYGPDGYERTLEGREPE